MTPVEEPTSERSSEISVILRTISELLETRQYEQVAELLDKAWVANKRANHIARADILAAAQQICLACSQCQAEKTWHQQAYGQSGQREDRLKQHLQAILDLLGDDGGAEAVQKQAQPPTPSPSPTELGSVESEVSTPEEHLRLWQHIQDLLEKRPNQRPEHERVTELTEILVTSLIEENGVQAAPSTEKIEASVSPFSGKVQMAIEPLVSDERQVEPSLPSLVVYCLGRFQVYQNDQPIEEWTSSKGKMVFKYLITHRERRIAKEILMNLFWPDANPDAARNNLNVAIYSLRQTLRKGRPDLSQVLFQDDHYLLNPELHIWVDVEAFVGHVKAAQGLEQRGDLTAAIHEYRAAEALYQGEFLAEDRYEDWLLPQRQRLEADYLDILDHLSRYYFDQANYDVCATMCDKMLAIDSCREEAHRRLMRCYSQQKQRHLALRQYHLCVEVLARELDIGPSQTTIDLYEQIRQKRLL